VYDMYHWDSSAQATKDTGNTRQARARARRPAAAAQAVQVALDRRDNGGDASDPSGQIGRGGGVEASRGRGGGAGSQFGRGGGAGSQ
jgi:hypothetical protein